ncbi:MAG: dimethylamine corrinoid protein [Methanolobus sp.]|jgi:trimethylamine corrinoid protein|nr:dimethylamine corrinoid protein [Methanolobus sp.]MDK2825818.1 dimethylamine corrinoid protein [Methanolobus sp.]MDK2948154.1 dimethylamine corrinoid protein [Methanolobus sp.]
MSNEDVFEKLAECVVENDEDTGADLIGQAIADGVNPVEIIEKGLSAGMLEVGNRFEDGEIFLPQVMMAAALMTKLVAKVQEHIPAGEKAASNGKIVLGTVEGDVHDIGKNIVKVLLQANGYEVFDLGRDAPLTSFIEKAKEVDADVVASSALMTGTMAFQADIENMLKEAGIRDRVKTMVGGAPCTEHWREKIGADVYASNASDAVQKVREALTN